MNDTPTAVTCILLVGLALVCAVAECRWIAGDSGDDDGEAQ